MKLKVLLLFAIILFMVLMPSCKKKIYAVVIVTIENSEVEYRFWSISYDLKLTETEGKDCRIIANELSVIDGSGSVLYSNSSPMSVPLAGNATYTKSYSGFLIGMYEWYTKPVKLKHTIQYIDSDSGNTYTAYGELIIHSL